MKPIVYTSSDFGSPKLTNTWGSLVAMLKTILVDGLPSYNCTFVATANDTLRVTLTTDGATLATESVVYMTIRNARYRFHVKSYAGNMDYIIKCYDTITIGDITTATPGVVERPSLGYKLVYNDIANSGKAVFQNKNGWLLRVHDELPKENKFWLSTYAKCARVSYGKSMTDIDTWNPQPSNYDTSIPDSWKQPHYLSSTTTTNTDLLRPSRNYWVYSTGDTMLSTSLSAVPTTTQIPYTIVGNDEFFHFFLQPIATSSTYNMRKYQYIFGNFNSLASGDYNNCVLYSTNNINGSSMLRDYHSGIFYNRTARTGDAYTNHLFRPSIASLYDQSVPANGADCGHAWMGVINANDNFSGGNRGTFPSMTSDVGSIMFSPIYIIENNNILRGIFKNTYSILNDVSSIFNGDSSGYSLISANNSNVPDMKYHIVSCTYNYDVSPRTTLSIMINLYEES